MKKTMMLVALMAAVASPAAAQRGAVLDPAAQERVKQLLQKLSQELQLQGGQPASDPLARYLYPPDLVMAHQDAIGLTDAQRTGIAQAALATQVSVMTTQSRLVSVTGQLSKALSVSKVDEASVLQLVDQVLAAERDVKRAQVTLLIHIKNQLTAEQQASLDKLRKQNWGAE